MDLKSGLQNLVKKSRFKVWGAGLRPRGQNGVSVKKYFWSIINRHRVYLFNFLSKFLKFDSLNVLLKVTGASCPRFFKVFKAGCPGY